MRALLLGLFVSGVALSASADPLVEQAQRWFGDGQPPAEVAALNPAEVSLGHQLFFDDRIGKDGTSCGSCHVYEKGGADGRATAIGAFGRIGKRNTPTVVDITPQISMHWIGDRASLADQAIRSLTAPPAYAHDSVEGALAVVQALPDLTQQFDALYDDGVTAENWGRALTAYQVSLVTESPFDRYLQGDVNALTDGQKQGLRTFMDTGCAACHSGRLLGGNSYQRFGLVEDYLPYTGSVYDAGRMALTGNPADDRVYKVPPIRHAVQTAPYFHDGSVDDIERAVWIMAKVQLGRDLADEQVASIVTFLQAATAPMPLAMKPPVLP